MYMDPKKFTCHPIRIMFKYFCQSVSDAKLRIVKLQLYLIGSGTEEILMTLSLCGSEIESQNDFKFENDFNQRMRQRKIKLIKRDLVGQFA